MDDQGEGDYIETDEETELIRQCTESGKPCNRRIDDLAMPTKRNLLCSFKQYGYLFPKEKNERLKELLSIMFAMSPEETEKYFDQMRQMANEIAAKKRIKTKLRRMVATKKKKEVRKRAYCLFRNIIRVGLLHAATHEVPPLVSVRLRNLSDIVLQQLADLRGLPVPDRQHPNKVGRFLISAADWIAIAVENVYYTVQLKKNQELEEIEDIERKKLKGDETEDEFNPCNEGIYTSTPCNSEQLVIPKRCCKPDCLGRCQK